MNTAQRLIQDEREFYCFTHNGYYPKPVNPKRIENPYADIDAQIDCVARLTSGSQLVEREFTPAPPATPGKVCRTLED